MSNLPTDTSTNDTQAAIPSAPPSSPVTPSGNKEVVGASIDTKEGLVDATGQEMELPKEVVSAGVRMQPTTVPIPPAVAQMGVSPSGPSAPVQTAPAVVLPLSDDRIAQGLRQSVADSWRWLSEWCVKRLKQLHIGIRAAGGKFIRVKI